MQQQRILKKALPLGSAFFLFWAFNLAAECRYSGKTQPVAVAYIYDGDTVRLADGRRIRLIGINAPEIAKPERAGEEFAEEATEYLRGLLAKGQISFLLGREPQDRYGRTLGHLFVGNRLVSDQVLAKGLAYQVVIPPNGRFQECLQEAEGVARKSRLGVWSNYPRSVKELSVGERGFRLLHGQISAVKKISKGWIVEVDDRLALRLSHDVAATYRPAPDKHWLGKKVQIRGWIRPKAVSAPAHYQPWFMPVTHKAHLKITL